MLKIYEFSRELIDISQKNGRWVSGGFGSEVERFNHSVPEKIKDAVNCGDFRIDDNYPPEEQEYALIAREIDEYFILAVATGAIDDKERPLVVYRYFWIDKPKENIDGIGVLLKWWLKAGEPKFEFVEAQIYNEISYFVRDLSIIFDNNNCEPFNLRLAENLAKSQSYDFHMTKELTKFTFGQLHLLALHLQKQFNIPLSWAWNVRHLEHPERFTLIYCIDETFPYIINNIHHHKNLIKTIPNEKPSIEPIPEKMQLDDKIYGQIKQCFLDIVNHDLRQREEYLKQLTQYIEKYPIDQWNWKNLTEKEMIEKPWSLAKARYIALLVTFDQISIHTWLYWLTRRKKDNYEFSSFDLQMQLLNKIPESNGRLKFIEVGIINLLLEYTSGSLKSEQYEDIEWLLLQSNSVWNIHFTSYARKLMKQLVCRETRTNDEFCQKVIQNIQAQEFQQRNNKLEYHFSEYTRLARLFESKDNYALSALFYQLSMGKVPSHVFQQDYVQIIPTIQEKEIDIETGVRQKRKGYLFCIVSFLEAHLGIIIFFTLVILSLSAITYIVVQEYFPQFLNENSK